LISVTVGFAELDFGFDRLDVVSPNSYHDFSLVNLNRTLRGRLYQLASIGHYTSTMPHSGPTGSQGASRSLDHQGSHSLRLTTSATSPPSQQSNQYLLYTLFPCENCNKSYSALHHLEAHQRSSCNVSKRKISKLLASTKEFWEAKKKRRLDQNLPRTIDGQGTQTVEGPVPVRDTSLQNCNVFGSN
jgi:hypothetical protein